MIIYLTKIGKRIKLETDYPRHEKIYNTTGAKKAVKLFREDFNLKGKKLIIYQNRDDKIQPTKIETGSSISKMNRLARALLYVTEDYLRFQNEVSGVTAPVTHTQVIKVARTYINMALVDEKKSSK